MLRMKSLLMLEVLTEIQQEIFCVGVAGNIREYMHLNL